TEKHPDAHLFIHTNAYTVFPRGYDLVSWRRMLGMEKHIHFPTVNPIVKPASKEELTKLYNAADLYVSLSVAEGFGLPILEAMSCGTPALVPRNSAQVELVEGCGWLCDNVPEDMYYIVPHYVPMLTRYPAPDVNSFLECLEEAYSNPDLRDRYGRRARRRALRYSPRRVMPLWFELLDRLESELELFRAVEAGLR
ncbi:MAG: glycosyltransferase, partial [Deltaproteobacteria bacterium]|nr:glycosyltransferase [Deltaproteobacteria bacterium]